LSDGVAASPPPLKKLRREPDRRRLRIGIGAAAAALVLLVLGVLASEVRGALALVDPVARGDRQEPMTFEASVQRYDLFVAPAYPITGFMDGEVVSTRCEIAFADGTTAAVRGDRQVASEETSFGRSVGYFDAVAGETTVVCDNRGGSELFDRFLVVPRSSVLRWVSWALLGIGAVLGGVAVWLIRSGLRGRLVLVDPVS
jgi:hypothetical protein